MHELIGLVDDVETGKVILMRGICRDLLQLERCNLEEVLADLDFLHQDLATN